MRWLVGFILLIINQIIFAASFDCAEAANYAERTVCQHTELSVYDDYLNLIYRRLTNMLTDNTSLTQLKETQQRWLTERNLCDSLPCLQSSYHAGIEAFLKILDANTKEQRLDGRQIVKTLDGNWLADYSNQNAQGNLIISNAIGSSFKFNFDIVNGGNVGQMNNNARFIDKDAITVDDSVIMEQFSKTPCVTLFQFYSSSIEVVTTNACKNYTGNSVFFNGTYLKNAQVKELSLVELGLVSNTQEEERIKALTGKSYSILLNNCGFAVDHTLRSKYPDAKVIFSFIPHNAVYSGCIIMKNKKNIWIAVYDANNNKIKYFTDDPHFQNQLPRAITDWIAAKGKHTIEFMNKIN